MAVKPDSNDLILVPAGLKGVAAAETTIGSVRGSEGFYHYRQYDASSLARTQSVEAVWYLLLNGQLPANAAEEAEFASFIGTQRHLDLDPLVVGAVARATTAPHLGLISLLPLIGGEVPPSIDQTPAERRALATRIAAAVPTILAATYRFRKGLVPIASDPTLGHAADWIVMATGMHVEQQKASMVEAYLTSTIDHGFNASTFASRVVTSTGADFVSAMCAGVGALAGPLHGGAPALALSMIEDIGDPQNTASWVSNRLERGEKIMGFGHAVYRADDPRSTMLREVAIAHGGDLVERAVEIESRVLAFLKRWKPESKIVTNVEFYAGIVLYLAGLPADLFTSTFTVSRAIGWSAHICEQADNNKIIRPSAVYVGPEPTRAA
jgi:citrate synthase